MGTRRGVPRSSVPPLVDALRSALPKLSRAESVLLMAAGGWTALPAPGQQENTRIIHANNDKHNGIGPFIVKAPLCTFFIVLRVTKHFWFCDTLEQ